jgi:hypothetical protein
MIQDSGQAGALVDAVETLLAADEREGGNTMRALSGLIVLGVLSQLTIKGISIPDNLFRDVEQFVSA